MVTDGQKVWMTGWTDGCMDDAKNIPLTSSVDNKQVKSNGNIDFQKQQQKNPHSTVHQKLTQLNNYASYHSI